MGDVENVAGMLFRGVAAASAFQKEVEQAPPCSAVV